MIGWFLDNAHNAHDDDNGADLNVVVDFVVAVVLVVVVIAIVAVVVVVVAVVEVEEEEVAAFMMTMTNIEHFWT